MTRRCEVHEVGQSSNPCMNIQDEVEITIWDHYFDNISKKTKYPIVIFFIINRDKLDL